MRLEELPPDVRPREKILNRGPNALSDCELLALILRTGIAGKNVLQLSQELLAPSKAAGAQSGLAGLFQASNTRLRAVKGLGPAKTAELMAVMELARRAMAQQLEVRQSMNSPEAVQLYLQLHLAHKDHEAFAMLFLDAQHRLIGMETLFRGTLTQTSVYPREVVLRALHHKAGAVVLAHNHPSGTVQPSPADKSLTQILKAALDLVDIHLLDHVIVGPGQALSMAQKGFI